MNNQIVSNMSDVIDSGNYYSLPKHVWEQNILTDDMSWMYEELTTTYLIRDTYTTNIGFHIVTTELIEILVKLINKKSVIELGCGTGFLVKELTNNGINITGVDDMSWGLKNLCLDANDHIIDFDILKLDITDFDVIILAWPPYKSTVAYDIIKRMHKGQVLMYVGESWDGCTADNQFHGVIDDEDKFKYFPHISKQLSQSRVSFYGIHDEWYVYKMK